MVILVVAFVVVAVVGVELLTAVLPLVIVLLFVPPGERAGLAEVLAAADSTPRLRLWSAANTAVLARRRALSAVGPRGPTAPTTSGDDGRRRVERDANRR
jgi:hypothetical protein